jgi:hypothetical protein
LGKAAVSSWAWMVTENISARRAAAPLARTQCIFMTAAL